MLTIPLIYITPKENINKRSIKRKYHAINIKRETGITRAISGLNSRQL